MMKNFFLFIVIVTLTSCSTEQKEVSHDRLVERDGLLYQVNSTVPFTGLSVIYILDLTVPVRLGERRLVERKKYIDGKLNGQLEIYHENTQLNISGTYQENQKTGEWNSFYENGKKRELILYSNNEPRKIQKYNLNNQLVVDITEGTGEFETKHISTEDLLIYPFNLQNLERNLLTTLDQLSEIPNSFYNLKMRVINWKPHGNSISFYKNGEVHGKWFFQNGLLQGPQEVFKNNKLLSKLNFENGNLDGSYEMYYPSGEILFRRNYVKGQKEGEQKEFYINGQEERVSIYKEGKLNSTVTKFSKSGTVRSVYNYKDDLKDGWYKIYETDGLLKEQGKYLNGRRNGERKVFGGEFLDLELIECWFEDKLLDKYEPNVGYITRDLSIEMLIKKGEFCE